MEEKEEIEEVDAEEKRVEKKEHLIYEKMIKVKEEEWKRVIKVEKAVTEVMKMT